MSKTKSGYTIDRTIAPRKLTFDNGAIYTEFTTTAKNTRGEPITFIVQGEKNFDDVEVKEKNTAKEPTPNEIIMKMFVGIIKGMGGVA